MPWSSASEAITVPAGLFPRQGFRLVSTTAHRDLQELPAAERAPLERACAKRQGEFAAGRHCLRLALAALGVTDELPPPDAGGKLPWPPGTVGSISHTRGLVVAVAALLETVPGLGVDVEDITRPFPQDILSRVLRHEERADLNGLPVEQRDLHAYALFSTKESVYKCACAATGTRLRFADMAISLNLSRGAFVVSFRHALPGWPPALYGRVGRSRDHVFTGLWWPPAADPMESS